MKRASPSTAVSLLFLIAALLLDPSLGILTRTRTPAATVSKRKTQAKNAVLRNKLAVPHPLRQRGPFAAGRANRDDALRAIDGVSLLKYSVALYVQTTLSYGMWVVVDWALSQCSDHRLSVATGSRGFRWLLVYVLNLNTGIFNPQSTVSETVAGDLSPNRKRPSWTPPGWVFVLMWPLFVFGTRAYAMVAVAEAVGSFANPFTLAMMFHFAIGGLWSHVNRVRNQLGPSMVLLWGLFATKAGAAYLAYRIVPTAGIALACTLSWLGAAAALGTATWKLNPDPRTGQREPLLPRK